MGSAWHALAGVQVEELVNLGGGQSVSYLQLLHDEHLSGQRLLSKPGPFHILPRDCRGRHDGVRLVLKAHLKKNNNKWAFSEADVLVR